MPFALYLTSRHTGEGLWLGCQYPTREDAAQAARRDVCDRCQRWEVVQIQDGMQWVNRRDGFKPLAVKGAR